MKLAFELLMTVTTVGKRGDTPGRGGVNPGYKLQPLQHKAFGVTFENL